MRTPLTILAAVAVIAFMGCSPKKEASNNYKSIKTEDPAMIAAIQQAKASVGDFVQAFHAQKAGTKGFYVKKAYPTPAGQVEDVWIRVLEEKGGTLQGRIANQAEVTQEVKFGQTVTLNISEISDWKYQDGKKLVGGYTIRYFAEKMSPEERAAFLKEAGFEL